MRLAFGPLRDIVHLYNNEEIKHLVWTLGLLYILHVNGAHFGFFGGQVAPYPLSSLR
jgi:hypothetical protein